MDYKHWCKFLEPETLIKWETEIIIGERIGTINRDFNNLKSFGYDFISHIILLHLILYFLISFNRKINVYFLLILFFYAVLIKATSLFYIFIFLGIFIFLYIRRTKIHFENNEKKFNITLISLIIIFFCNSIINSGCITYFIDFTCSKKFFNWAINLDQINNFSEHVELTAKGFYHQNAVDRMANPNDYLYLSSFFTVEPSNYTSDFRDLTSYTKELFTSFIYNESSGFYETLFRGIKIVLKKRSSLTNTEEDSLDKYIPSYRGYEKYKFAAIIRVVEEDDTLIAGEIT